MKTAEERYAALCEAFAGRADVKPPGKKGFGANALTADGKIFAMLAQGTLVVKLPRARVDALVAAGDGVRFDAGQRRPPRATAEADRGADRRAGAKAPAPDRDRPPGRARAPMKEWIALHHDTAARWRKLAEEAFAFVRGS